MHEILLWWSGLKEVKPHGLKIAASFEIYADLFIVSHHRNENLYNFSLSFSKKSSSFSKAPMFEQFSACLLSVSIDSTHQHSREMRDDCMYTAHTHRGSSSIAGDILITISSCIIQTSVSFCIPNTKLWLLFLPILPASLSSSASWSNPSSAWYLINGFHIQPHNHA